MTILIPGGSFHFDLPIVDVHELLVLIIKLVEAGSVAHCLVVTLQRRLSGSADLVGIGLSPGGGDFPLLGLSNTGVLAV